MLPYEKFYNHPFHYYMQNTKVCAKYCGVHHSSKLSMSLQNVNNIFDKQKTMTDNIICGYSKTVTDIHANPCFNFLSVRLGLNIAIFFKLQRGYYK